jgi:hypothetical protein
VVNWQQESHRPVKHPYAVYGCHPVGLALYAVIRTTSGTGRCNEVTKSAELVKLCLATKLYDDVIRNQNISTVARCDRALPHASLVFHAGDRISQRRHASQNIEADQSRNL